MTQIRIARKDNNTFTYCVSFGGAKHTYTTYEYAMDIFHRIMRWNRHGAKYPVTLSQYKNGKFYRVMLINK